MVCVPDVFPKRFPLYGLRLPRPGNGAGFTLQANSYAIRIDCFRCQCYTGDFPAKSLMSGGHLMSVYEIRLDPDEDAVDGRYLDDLLARWLRHCATSCDAYTVSGYREKIQHFRKWWQSVAPPHNWRLTPSLCVTFELDLRTIPSKTGKPLAYGTRYNVIRVLRSALKWAFDTNRLGINCRMWFPMPTGEPPKRIAATLPQLEHLIQCAGQSHSPARDQAILAIFIGTGLRRTECARLNVEHIAFCADGTGLADITGKRTSANKGGKRQVAIDAITMSYVACYLVEAGLTTGPLFRRKRGGGRLSAVGLYRIVKSAIRAAGLEGRIQGCHDLRRAFTTHFVKLHPGTIYADMLRRQLGHKHFRQTADYNLMDADDLRLHITSPLSQR